MARNNSVSASLDKLDKIIRDDNKWYEDYHTCPVDSNAVKNCEYFLEHLFNHPQAIWSTTTGGVVLEWAKGDSLLEILFLANDVLRVYVYWDGQLYDKQIKVDCSECAVSGYNDLITNFLNDSLNSTMLSSVI